MAFQGFEADRGTLKYRCPAAAYDLHSQGRALCHKQAGCAAGDYRNHEYRVTGRGKG